MAYVKIKDKNLIRDTYSKAVLNTDRAGLEQYHAQRHIARQSQQDKLETKTRIIQLEKDMTDIKDLLKQIAMARKP